MSNKTRLIIVGAGPSGAAAAYRLLQSKFEDFVILEARDRVGGRIYSLPVGRKHLEIGAQWIHGEEGNDAYDIADAQGLVYDEFAASSSSSDDGNADEDGVDAALSKPICDLASEWRDVMFVTDQGTALPDQIARKMGVVTATLEAEEYGKLWRPLGGAAEEEVKNAGQSFTACLDALVDTEYEELKPWRDPFLNWVNRYMNTVDASDCWTQVSPTYTYHRCPGNPAVAIKPRKGYKGVVEYLLRDVPGDKLILNKEVTDIDWTSETEIKVTCKDGTQYVGEKCLVTLPVGVLRHPNGPKFSPSLPSKKVDALNAIGFGVVDKLFLKFPRRWWPDSAEDGFSLLWTNEEDEEFEGWPRSVLGFYANPGSDRVLCGWISGDAAREMESKSINEVQDVCVRLLRKFTRGLGIKVPDPIQTFRSSWHSDPFARGSYSFRTVDCDEKSLGHADLGEPVPNSDNPRLLFAGEATHPNFYSTVHGAIGSGYREADRVLQTMKAT